jgi:hypothetical protein
MGRYFCCLRKSHLVLFLTQPQEMVKEDSPHTATKESPNKPAAKDAVKANTEEKHDHRYHPFRKSRGTRGGRGRGFHDRPHEAHGGDNGLFALLFYLIH